MNQNQLTVTGVYLDPNTNQQVTVNCVVPINPGQSSIILLDFICAADGGPILRPAKPPTT